MALFLFTKKILAGEPIEVFNNGHHTRDFTYIDDVVEGVLRTLDRIAAPDPAWSGERPDPGTSAAPYRLYNIGNHEPVKLMEFIGVLEAALGREAKEFLPRQPGDVETTFADVEALAADVGFAPRRSPRVSGASSRGIRAIWLPMTPARRPRGGTHRLVARAGGQDRSRELARRARWLAGLRAVWESAPRHPWRSRRSLHVPASFLVVDDHPLFREAIQLAIGLAYPEARMAEATSIAGAKEAIAREGPFDLVLLDLSMPARTASTACSSCGLPPTPSCRS